MKFVCKEIIFTFLIFKILTRSVLTLDIDNCIKNVKPESEHADNLVDHEKLKYQESAQTGINDGSQTMDAEVHNGNTDCENDNTGARRVKIQSGDRLSTTKQERYIKTEFDQKGDLADLDDTDEDDDNDVDDDEDEDEDADDLEDIDEDDENEDDDEDDENEDNTYEFPPLTRLDPEFVGHEVHLELVDGVWFTRITRAMEPPLFEIPGFLSNEEYNYIIEAAKDNGLAMSGLFGGDVQKEFDEGRPLDEVTRVAQSTWLNGDHIGEEFWSRLQHRISKLTNLPVELIQRGEPMQVVSYSTGGHYHVHLDTTQNTDTPCCMQTRCGEQENTPDWTDCCRLCRYVTVLYYLEDVEDGGETAFPIADADDSVVEEKFADDVNFDWYNLSHHCYNSSLLVEPKKGTAIMWYSHFVDEETGYLGKADLRSHHGGCDIKKGSKWIANNWISSTTFKDRFKPSLYYTGP